MPGLNGYNNALIFFTKIKFPLVTFNNITLATTSENE